MGSNMTLRTLLLGAVVALVCPSASGQLSYPTTDTYAGSSSPGLLDGAYATAHFSGPYGVCFDPVEGAIYVADGFNHCIRKLMNGQVTTIAGNGSPGDVDGVGQNAQFNTPTGVFFKNGFLYICDDFNNKIKRMDSLFNVETIAGNGGSGFADGPALAAMFHQPKSLAVDSAGVVYVADYENHRIRKIEAGTVTTVAGDGNAGDGLGPALSASLYRPRDLCLDDLGNVYFVDLMNHRIKVLTTAGDVELVAGSGTQGNADGIGALAEFSIPVAIDWEAPGTLMVLDAVNPLLRRVTTAGVVTTVAGSGGTGYVDGNSVSAEFDLPQDICFNSYGELFVGDRNNNAIRILYPHGEKPLSTTEQPAANAPELVAANLPVQPNPTQDVVLINLSHIPDPLTGLLVYDEKGALVLRMEQGDLAGFGRGAATIDATGWPAGQYAVLVSTRSRLYRSVFIKE